VPADMTSLGVYQDGPFRLVATDEGQRLAPDPADAPFFRFVAEVGGHFDSFAVFARVVDAEGGDVCSLLPPGTRVVHLPDYGGLRRPGSALKAAFRTGTAFWRALPNVDAVWTFGPHPFELLLVALASLRGKQVVLGVRQDSPAYFRARLPSARWKPLLLGVDAIDALHRLVARRAQTTAVGEGIARRYRHGRVLTISPSLVPSEAVVSEPPQRDWTRDVTLLTVGRIDAEKNPLLLVEALAELERRRRGVYRLRWAGEGPLVDAVRRRARELGVEERLELLGYLPFPELLPLYREAHAFVHVSFTEGVPQVLTEALASGAPIVATDVGGVRAALDEGRAALLVAPDDLEALVSAIVRLADEPALRADLATRGLQLAADRTIDVQAERVARFIRDG
jgi:glycosyltransferase involved in cell wall biosynthesis